MELDPLFVRGLRLLHSRSKDSTDQLRALLEEVKSRSGRNGGKHSPANMSPRSTSSLQRTDNPHKRSYDKMKDDSSDVSKKIHLDMQYKSYPSSPAMSRDSDISKKSDDSDLNDTAGLEMDFMDQLACVVCKNIGVTTGNQLKECQECGSLYHQDCHRPPISEHDRGDTRAIWVCSKCRDLQPAPAVSTTTNRSIIKASSSSKIERMKSEAPVPKRELKTSLSSRTTSSSSAGLKSSSRSSGAILGGSSTSTARSQPASSGPAPPPNSMVSAERRMQLMKKKAAAKLNEKRKN